MKKPGGFRYVATSQSIDTLFRGCGLKGASAAPKRGQIDRQTLLAGYKNIKLFQRFPRLLH
jgi:hypothetical protein